jgi:hypothetical protein
LGATALEAQETELSESETFCIAGRPLPSCQSFLVATGGKYPRIGGSSYGREFEVNGKTIRLEFPEMYNHFDVEIGVLANRSPETALGAALSVGYSTGLRVALNARYRRWLGRYAALEAGVGVLRAPVHLEARTDNRIDYSYGYGVTGDVTLGLTDWISLSGRGDIVWSAGEPVHALYGGVRLGSLPTLFTGIVAAVGLAAVGGAS